MTVKRFLYRKLQTCKLLEELDILGVRVEILESLYKGTTKVYHSYEKGSHCITTDLEYSSVKSSALLAIRSRPIKIKKSFNFLQLKLLKLC